MKDITVVARVLSKTQEIEVRGKKYASAIIADESGEIMLNLWRDQVGQFDV